MPTPAGEPSARRAEQQGLDARWTIRRPDLDGPPAVVAPETVGSLELNVHGQRTSRVLNLIGRQVYLYDAIEGEAISANFVDTVREPFVTCELAN